MASSSSPSTSTSANRSEAAENNDIKALVNISGNGNVTVTVAPNSSDSSTPPRRLAVSFSDTPITDLSSLTSLHLAPTTLFLDSKQKLQVIRFASDAIACHLLNSSDNDGQKMPLDLTMTYDPQADASYLRLCKAKVAKTEQIESAPVPMVVDFDAEGHLIGLEILSAKALLPIRRVHTGPSYRVGILTISDRCSRGEADDLSGPAIQEFLESEKAGKLSVSGFEMACVPDERDVIAATLKDWCDNKKIPLILTTGGTGFAPRDVTPEATKDVLEKEAPGIVIAMISASLQVTPHAMLSRPAAGIRNKSLIINLPGSVKAVKENIAAIIVALPHAIGLIVDAAGSSTVSSHQNVAK